MRSGSGRSASAAKHQKSAQIGKCLALGNEFAPDGAGTGWKGFQHLLHIVVHSYPDRDRGIGSEKRPHEVQGVYTCFQYNLGSPLDRPVVGDGNGALLNFLPFESSVVVDELSGFGGKLVAFDVPYLEVVFDYGTGRYVLASHVGAPEQFGLDAVSLIELEILIDGVLILTDLQPDRDFLYFSVVFNFNEKAHSLRELAGDTGGKHRDVMVVTFGENACGVRYAKYQRKSDYQHQ